MGDVEDFLAHYGIKGQKWGIRRKTNKHSKRVQRLDKKIKIEKQNLKDLDDAIKLSRSDRSKGGRLDTETFESQRPYLVDRIRLLKKGKRASEEVLKSMSNTSLKA